MIKTELKQNFTNALRFHDWFFDFSDDHSVWTRGRDEKASLVAMGKQHSSIRVDFVCDRYFDTSIKSGERERRSKGDCQVISLYYGS